MKDGAGFNLSVKMFQCLGAEDLKEKMFQWRNRFHESKLFAKLFDLCKFLRCNVNC